MAATSATWVPSGRPVRENEPEALVRPIARLPRTNTRASATGSPSTVLTVPSSVAVSGVESAAAARGIPSENCRAARARPSRSTVISPVAAVPSAAKAVTSAFAGTPHSTNSPWGPVTARALRRLAVTPVVRLTEMSLHMAFTVAPARPESVAASFTRPMMYPVPGRRPPGQADP